MSLILDALKRAERERNAQKTPVLADLAYSSNAPKPLRQYWRRHFLFGSLFLLGLIITALLLWTTLRKASRPALETVAVNQPPASPAPAPAPTPALAPAPSVIPGTESVASLDDLTDDPVEAETKPVLQDAESLPPSGIKTESAAPGATPAPAPPPQSPPADSAPATAPPEPVNTPAPTTEVPPVLTQPAPMRKLREMPPDYRADFPVLTVEVHVYERELAKRMVMINGRRYREGERLAEGPVVVEIVREGIVFEHRGEKVLYTLSR